MDHNADETDALFTGEAMIVPPARSTATTVIPVSIATGLCFQTGIAEIIDILLNHIKCIGSSIHSQAYDN